MTAVRGTAAPPRWWRRPGRRAPVVLLYHGFAEAVRSDDPENLFVPLPELDRQLRWLRSEGWEILDWDTWEAIRVGRRRRPRRSVLITIDDAYVSTRAGVEVLTEHRAPSVLYVPVGLVGETATWLPEPEHEPLLTAQQLRGLGPLVDIGTHGWDHTSLAGRSPADLVQQTETARELLVEMVGPVVPSFAYPFGDHDRRARQAVAGAGFSWAFSVFDDVGDHAISRVDVNATDTLATFRLKLMPGYRRVWRLLDRVAVVRRATRAVLTRRAGDA